ncbi:hypothetical protein [Amycolatopsis sp. lyj-108]|uniref:aromatic-ring hydroxylase C-terminal domain-containing protein n=1 Tax=Amycolatopsis sp. lyj-108 TaxID=2789286 RepID=UPI0039799925
MAFATSVDVAWVTRHRTRVVRPGSRVFVDATRVFGLRTRECGIQARELRPQARELRLHVLPDRPPRSLPSHCHQESHLTVAKASFTTVRVGKEALATRRTRTQERHRPGATTRSTYPSITRIAAHDPRGEVRAGTNGRVRLVEADSDQAFLMRPDGYVAWAAPQGETTGLTEALALVAGTDGGHV